MDYMFEGNAFYDGLKALRMMRRGEIPMIYALKASRKVHRVHMYPCPDCKTNPPSVFEADEHCLRHCDYGIIIEILDPRQLQIYNKHKSERIEKNIHKQG